MKASIISLLLLGASAHATPKAPSVASADNILPEPLTYVGGDLPQDDAKNLLDARDSQRRCTCFPCWSRGQPCNPGKCECYGSDGCYSCRGGRSVCQPGPGSNICLQ
ncbi:hypothetical protein E4U42_004409 [Claviceps africana]|uniref:Uncharacterized protein n=1 Tax=Claviceps africana TaxID=83212 RepID=A0A8K0J5G4_9HYPO|nr:hypothetical protein E4U42_004409 [Claviceps africana]